MNTKWQRMESYWYWASDYGNLVKLSTGWYGTNDSRASDRKVFGDLLRKKDTVLPTVGPFKTRADAATAYKQAIGW
jgi:hypothetical protein